MKQSLHIWFLALGVLLVSLPVWASCSNTVTVNDGNNTARTFCRGTDGGSNYISFFNLVDSTGANIATLTGNALDINLKTVASALHLSTNIDQLNGTTIDTNSGTKSAGTIRMVIATDQPQLTNKLLVTPDSVALPANQSVNVAQVAGTTTDTNSGNKSAGTQRVVLATDQPNFTTALNVSAAESGTWTVQPGNTPNTSAWLTQPVPGTANGCTPYHLAGGTAASTNSTNVKSSAGNLCDVLLINTTATIYYFKLYDSSSAPTCSSATNIKHVFPIPASTSGSGLIRSLPMGESYANGIGYCVTGGGGDTDNTNAATGVFIEASYK